MADHILKADTYEKQSAKWRKQNSIRDIELTHWLLPKYDGCHAIIDTTTCEVWSREMKPVLSMRLQAVKVRELLGPGLMVQGEAWFPGRDFPTVSGQFRQHEQNDLVFVAFNCLTKEEFEAGYSNAPYHERFDRLFPLYLDKRWPDVTRAQHYPAGTYGSSTQRAAEYKAKGSFDGAILADPWAAWSRGRSRNGELIKVKPNISLDLRVTKLYCETGEKTGRQVWTADVVYRGVTSRVGSGMPHDADAVPKVGQIIEVEAMGLTEDGRLREPRFKSIRHDKEEPDT